MLVVAQSHTPRPGLSSLPCVRQESACLRELMPGEGHEFFEDEKAKFIQAYREKLNRELQTQSEIINERYVTIDC